MNENWCVDADWILGFFGAAVLGGGKFQPDETVQIGWMIVILKSNGNGDLEIWEPDGVAMPVRWVRGANATFRDLTIQKEVCALLSVEPSYPSMLQFGMVSRETLDSSAAFTMQRGPSNGNDSGWRIVASEEDMPSDTHSLYEISTWHRRVVPFLALPPGGKVEWTSDGLSLSLGSARISDDESALLADILTARAFS